MSRFSGTNSTSESTYSILHKCQKTMVPSVRNRLECSPGDWDVLQNAQHTAAYALNMPCEKHEPRSSANWSLASPVAALKQSTSLRNFSWVLRKRGCQRLSRRPANDAELVSQALDIFLPFAGGVRLLVEKFTLPFPEILVFLTCLVGTHVSRS